VWQSARRLIWLNDNWLQFCGGSSRAWQNKKIFLKKKLSFFGQMYFFVLSLFFKGKCLNFLS